MSARCASESGQCINSRVCNERDGCMYLPAPPKKPPSIFVPDWTAHTKLARARRCIQFLYLEEFTTEREYKAAMARLKKQGQP